MTDVGEVRDLTDMRTDTRRPCVGGADMEHRIRQVTDVGEARDVTGKGTSIKLTTAGGRVCYIADSETEQVEWLSALEGAVAKIVKQACA